MRSDVETSWRRTSFADLLESGVLEINDGYRAKNSELGSAGLPFARARNVRDGFDFTQADFLMPNSVTRAGLKVSQVHDVVFTSKGTVGRFALVNERTPSFVYSPQLSFWRVLDADALDPAFLYFWMQGPECRRQFAALKGQTDMADYISLRDQRTLKITMPGIQSQRRIASILAALDDKIDSNRRLAKLLEETARTEFRRRFGGRLEGAGELGSHVDVVRGRSYKSSELGASERALVTLKSIRRGGGYSPDGLKAYSGDFKSEQVVAPGELVVAHTDLTQKAEVIAKPAIVPNPAGYSALIASLDLAIVRPRTDTLSVPFLYFLLMESAFQQHAYGFANGSTVLHLDKQAIPSFPFEMPDRESLVTFNELVVPMFALGTGLESDTQPLAALRDALLPKLISGQIRVPDTTDPEEVVGPAAEELAEAAK